MKQECGARNPASPTTSPAGEVVGAVAAGSTQSCWRAAPVSVGAVGPRTLHFQTDSPLPGQALGH